MRYPSTQSFSTQASFTSMRSQSLSQHPSQRSVHTLSSIYTAEQSESPINLDPSNAETTTMTGTYFEPSFTHIRRSMAVDRPPTIPEPESDRLDDVALHDPKPKRHGLFSRFGVGSSAPDSADGTNRPNSSGGHGFFGRKRGVSGQGAELGAMGIRRPTSRGAPTAGKVETQMQPQMSSQLQIQPQPQLQAQTPSVVQLSQQAHTPQRPQTPQLQQEVQTSPAVSQSSQPPPQPPKQSQSQASLQIGPQAAVPASHTSTTSSTPEPQTKEEVKAES